VAEVILSTPDLTVLGGPSVVELDTNIGSAGSRGTFVMFGPVNPNDPAAEVFFIDTPLIFDLYILVNPASDDYLQVYQYVIQDGVEQWIATLKLTPNFYGTNRVVTFVDGVAELDINTFEIGLVQLRAGEFSTLNTKYLFGVQATLSNYEVLSEINPMISDAHMPAAVSVKVDDIFLDETDDELKIPITLYGAEFNGTGMQPIDNKNVIVHLSILVINPNDVTNFLPEGDS
jgi:hypothetical protein